MPHAVGSGSSYPKLGNIVASNMELKRRAGNEEVIELFVWDFRDAFYMCPLLPEERMYFVAHFRG